MSVYLIDNFFSHWGRTLNGEVHWSGDDSSDIGTIFVTDNVVTVEEGAHLRRGQKVVTEDSSLERRVEQLERTVAEMKEAQQEFDKALTHLLEKWESQIIPE